MPTCALATKMVKSVVDTDNATRMVSACVPWALLDPDVKGSAQEVRRQVLHHAMKMVSAHGTQLLSLPHASASQGSWDRHASLLAPGADLHCKSAPERVSAQCSAEAPAASAKMAPLERAVSCSARE